MQNFRKQRWHKRRHRRYRPSAKPNHFKRRDFERDADFQVEISDPQYVCSAIDIFDCAEEYLRKILMRHPRKLSLDEYADQLKTRFDKSNHPQDGLIALLAQAPRTVLAQLQMDKHPHGYRNRQDRLFELIDFNDTFDSAVLALSDTDRRRFLERIKPAMDRTCKRAGVPVFNNDQWEAIVRGLSREIAIYLAAQDSGFKVVMAPRSQDAIGIDIQVMDPESGRYVNLDIKSPQSFRRRLEQLLREGRLSEKGLLEADELGYVVTMNGRGENRAEVVTLSTLPDRLGEIDNFEFQDMRPIQKILNRLISEFGLIDNRFNVENLQKN